MESKALSFPDLSVRVNRNDDAYTIDIGTFSPDADDDGRPRDFGHTIIEGGTIVSDHDDGYDDGKIAQFASLLEHAPEMHQLLTALVQGREVNHERVKRLLTSIENGRTVYEYGM